MSEFCEQKGIKKGFSVARTPQQNGVAERRNRTLNEAARTMLADSKLPTTFWAETVNIACYVQNRVLVVKPHNKTPYELFRGRTPALSFMRPFGCHVTILNTLDYLGKFDGKSKKGFFVGYSLNSKAFRVYNIRTRKVEENLHIRFLEDKPIIAGTNSNDSMVYYLVLLQRMLAMMNHNLLVMLERRMMKVIRYESPTLLPTFQFLTTPNTRIHKGSNSLDHVIGDVQSGVLTRRMTKTTNEQGFISAVYEGKTHEDLHTCLFACFLSQEEPKKVWTLVDLLHGKRAIGTKWVYMNKKDERGIIIRNKARLVAQGYTQEEGIDYDEVFAPVARIEAIRLFLAYASFKDFIVYHMDVKSAFMYGKIEEEVYVCQPTGFEDPEFPDRVYKVEKALYGLHQAPRACQDKYVDEILKKFGFLTVKTTSTPMETSKPLLKDAEAKDVDQEDSQVTPKVSHLHGVKRIFRYLKGQPKLDLWYPKDSPFDLEAYSDSDYAGASLDRKSTTRGCQFLRSRLIFWQYKKQTVVANSTTKAEYVVAASCSGQVLWIQNQMLDYGYNFMNTKIFIDNESTIYIIKNLVFHSKTKHIEIRHYFIIDSNEKKLIQMIKIHTDQNVADLLTKNNLIIFVKDKLLFYRC
ncbi:retrovirus-related pol polyprotein from transposon TNT 1-94 [Tanacetum coccineum]